MTTKQLLLDTHIVMWLINDDPIKNDARDLIVTAEHIYCSAASIWELTIKAQAGKLKLPDLLLKLIIDSGIKLLDVTSEHTASIPSINLPHADPFDRLLVAQAQAEGLAFLTADQAILAAKYPFVLDATH